LKSKIARVGWKMVSSLKKPRNFVAKHANEFCKSKTFRNRKKEAKADGNYSEHPKHLPYKRSHHKWETDDE
jgi:hypothetical protein